MSNISIKDSSDTPRKVDTFARTEGADTVETQAVAIVDPANGNPARPDGAGNLPVAPNVSRGSGVADANTQRIVQASDSPDVTALTAVTTNLGAQADAAAGSDAGTFSLIAFIKRGLNNWTTLLARIPALVSGRMPVDGSGVTQPVSAAANLPTSNNATIFVFSTNNSSTAQLAAAATFTGTIETALDQPSISLLLTSDQPITLKVRQFIDLAGTRAAPDIVFYINASAGFARSFTLNGNYVQVLATNTGASTTTTFNLNTAYGALGDSDATGVQPITELPLVLRGAAAQTAAVNNILTPVSGAEWLNVSGFRAASVQVVSTGTGGTFIFEQSNDGVNPIVPPVFNAALINGVAVTAAITATASAIVYSFPIRCNFVRLRIATTITGGSIQAFSRISTEPWTPAVQSVANSTAANMQATVSGTVTANQGTMVALPAGANLVGDVAVQVRATTPGTTLANVLSAATNNLNQLKATAGKIAGGFLTNTTASLQYVKLFALPSASVTMGTTAATTQIALQPNQTINLSQGDFGLFLGGTGLTYAITTGSSLTDNTATTAGSVAGCILWV